MTQIRVDYARTVGTPGSFASTRVAGSVEVTLDEDADWQREWGFAYAGLKSQVDAAVGDVPAAPVPSTVSSESSSAPPTEPSSEPHDETPATHEVSQSPASIVPNQPVSFTGCRVMYPPKYYEAKGKRKEHLRMRIGNRDQIPVGTPQGYVNAKTYDPEAIKEWPKVFRQSDLVDVEGFFEEPWTKKNQQDGSSVEEWDLVVETITRV